MTYVEALAYIYSFANYEVSRMAPRTDLKLSRMTRLLELCGRPDRRFRSVLVAGTKGKGSTAAMLASISQAAGKRTGLYSSPHLSTHRERIRVNGELIPEAAFVERTIDIQRLVRGLGSGRPELGQPTTFELGTLLAFQHFAAENVELAVVEVGLGGRLDTTNVLDADLAIITSISFDHMDVLGATLPAIAGEKADIIKPGRPVISAPQAEEAMEPIARTATLRQAPLSVAVPALPDGPPLRIVAGKPLPDRIGQAFRPAGAPETPGYWMSLLGEHQLVNAGVAIEAAARLGFDERAARQGFQTVCWPGRLEVLRTRPLVVADGAHNRESMAKLVAAVDRHFARGGVRVIAGFSADKDIPAMAEVLTAFADEIVLTRSHHPRAADPAAIERYFPGARTAASVREALGIAPTSEDQLILVTGSLHPCGEARAVLGLVTPEEVDPF
ncbi:MAG: bifunctional folylpolyglutamate synthase/dihydrofolate synthase [Chloroflexota bacterium]|nr:bifunctional folylpolyglutamate synthase/dihydrofolate synthase [Chloroflexota bacterium]